MPWTDTDPMTERCQRFGISRKTGYKWLNRYRNGGVDALRDRSRAPKHCPHRTPEPVRLRIRRGGRFRFDPAKKNLLPVVDLDKDGPRFVPLDAVRWVLDTDGTRRELAAI